MCRWYGDSPISFEHLFKIVKHYSKYTLIKLNKMLFNIDEMMQKV